MPKRGWMKKRNSKLMNREKLERLRELPSLGNAIGIIDSHLILYDELRVERSANRLLTRELNKCLGDS